MDPLEERTIEVEKDDQEKHLEKLYGNVNIQL
jgi:hypothetical protein